ncbi:MAG: hypothetical protein ABUL60_07180 [Myxococcales bacterium]
MQHEFTHCGSNAFLSSHVCDICGLVVTTAKSESQSALPLDGCFARNVAPNSLEQRAQERE